MKKAFTATTQDMAILLDEQLSANQGMTPEGYLICKNVPVSRTGVQYYLGQELGLSNRLNERIPVYRLAEDVFEQESLQSLESKPITDDHPQQQVTVHNAGFLAFGHGRNVRHDDKYVMADLVVMNPGLIEGIRAKKKYEISLGYTCQYIPFKDGYRQKNIRVNHIAVVESGRAGSKVSIKDKMPISVNNRRKHTMDQLKASILSAYAKDADTTADDLAKAAQLLMTDAAPAAKPAEADKTEKSLLAMLLSGFAKDAKPAPAEADKPLTADDIKKLVADSVAEALKKQAKDAKPAAGKDAAAKLLDTLLKDAGSDEDKDEEGKETDDADEDWEEKETGDGDGDDDDDDDDDKKKEANDAAFANVVKAIQPFYSKMSKKEQRQVKDQLTKLQKKPSASGYAGILKAIKSHKTGDQAPTQVVAQDSISRKVMESRNPHYAKKA